MATYFIEILPYLMKLIKSLYDKYLAGITVLDFHFEKSNSNRKFESLDYSDCDI